MEIDGIEITKLKELGKSKRKDFENLVPKIKRQNNKVLDNLINEKHEGLFQKIDCLNCANCCKTTSPLLYQTDINRIAKYLNEKPSNIFKQYVEMDEDGDFVFKSTPCPFLNSDNVCSIYEARPKACREYPHTQQRKQKSIINISLENSSICPAVFRIFEYLEEVL